MVTGHVGVNRIVGQKDEMAAHISVIECSSTVYNNLLTLVMTPIFTPLLTKTKFPFVRRACGWHDEVVAGLFEPRLSPTGSMLQRMRIGKKRGLVWGWSNCAWS